MKHRITISADRGSIAGYSERRYVKKCIWTALRAQKVRIPCEINVLLTDDAGIQEINKTMRDVDKPTDVLSFPMFDLTAGIPPAGGEYIDEESGLCPLGDMAISMERVYAQAEEFGHSRARELGYLTVHSVLHLLGYDHLDEGEQKAQMREREEAIMTVVK